MYIMVTEYARYYYTQNILRNVEYCLGQSVGSLLGGPLFERYGGAVTFRMFGASAIILLVSYLIWQMFCVQITNGDEVTISEITKGRSCLL